MIRMRMWKRIFIIIGALAGIAGLVEFLLEVCGCGYASAVRKFLSLETGGADRVLLVEFFAAAVLVLALFVLIIVIAACSGRIRAANMLLLTDKKGDSVLLSFQTLNDLARLAVGEPAGLHNIEVETGYSDYKATVEVKASVSADVNIPEETAAIQNRVREQLENVCGIPVSNVDVYIIELNKDTAVKTDADEVTKTVSEDVQILPVTDEEVKTDEQPSSEVEEAKTDEQPSSETEEVENTVDAEDVQTEKE